MTSFAKLPLLALVLAAFASGCSAESGAAPSSANDEVRSGPRQSDEACISQLPDAVYSLAARLELGRPMTSEGAAGSLYFEFADGSVVRWSNVESKISEVRLVAKEGGGEESSVPVEVAVAAEKHALGRLITADGAAGSIYFSFTRGVVRWSNVESKISSVLREDGSAIAPAAPIPAAKPTEVCFEQLPAAVWSIAASLELGPPVSEEGAAGSFYYTYGNGTIIRWNNVEEKMTSIKVPTEEGEVDMPVAVAVAARAAGLGALVSSDGAAGSIYFEFARGVVRWNNHDSKVSEVTAN